MLQFDFGDETETAVEFVGGEEDEAVDVELVGHIAGVEVGLAVGAETEAVIPCQVLRFGKCGIDVIRRERVIISKTFAEGLGGERMHACKTDGGNTGGGEYLLCFHRWMRFRGRNGIDLLRTVLNCKNYFENGSQ